VLALAKVYDHLLGTGLTRTIDFGHYLSALCEAFEEMESAQRRDTVLICNTKAMQLDLDTATPLGLVVAELISNSYRHAFPNGKGTITVSLSGGDPENHGAISFADDGVGFTAKGKSNRRGTGLVKRLMEQIDGTAEVQSNHGTTWVLKFPTPKVFAEDDSTPVQ
jgi:two-component sensor histidine kinase